MKFFFGRLYGKKWNKCYVLEKISDLPESNERYRRFSCIRKHKSILSSRNEENDLPGVPVYQKDFE